MTYTLYGVEGSYYAAKARSALLQKGIDFVEMQCDRRAFSEVIVPRVGYPIVPIVITPDDKTLQDTAEILDALEARHPQPPLVPSTPRRRIAAYLMELVADEWLKLPALHYRWYYDYEFARDMMGYNNDPHASSAEQQRVGTTIAARFQDWPYHLGVDEATRGAVEAEFLALLDLLEEHFASTDYLLGVAPSIADCALMGPLYAHLFRDPYSGVLVRERAPAVCAWIERMRHRPGNRAQLDDPDDRLPPTLCAVLRRLTIDFVPTIVTAIEHLQGWLKAHPAQTIPRYAGRHAFRLARGQTWEAAGTRSIHPFEQWKVQRFVARALPADKPLATEVRCLEDLGCGALLRLELPIRLHRRGFRLTADTA